MKKTTGFHGSNSRFSKFEQSKARIVNDFYGGGVAYFTESLQVGKSYATTMSRRYGGDGFVYECQLHFDKLFDVNAEFTGDELKRLLTRDVEQFARGARLLKLGVDKSNVISKLREGTAKLSGDEVFRGMSNGMLATAEARRKLIAMGYDGLRYNGGMNMNMATKHDVYLAYKASQITIMKRYIVSKTQVTSTEKQEVYSYI